MTEQLQLWDQARHEQIREQGYYIRVPVNHGINGYENYASTEEALNAHPEVPKDQPNDWEMIWLEAPHVPTPGMIVGRDIYEAYKAVIEEKRLAYLASGNWPDARLMKTVRWHGVDPDLKKTYERMAELLMEQLKNDTRLE